MGRAGRAAVVLAILFLCGALARGQVSDNLLANPSFEAGWQSNGAPSGWEKYGARAGGVSVSLGASEDAADGAHSLLMNDGDAGQEIGVSQKVKAEGDLNYRVTARVRAAEGANASGAHIQLRFSPSNKFEQTSLSSAKPDGFSTFAVQGRAPKGTKSLRVYIYTHKDPTPRFLVDNVELVSSADEFPELAGPWPPMVPPQYSKLKPLYIETALARGGASQAVIVAPASGAYDAQARAIADAIRAKSGVDVPIVGDDSPHAALPPKTHIITLGNRSTNALISELYNRYFTLLDLRYPGPGGSVVRTLHNPFGGGINVVFAGGSDAEGVAKATGRLCGRIAEAKGGRGDLVLGRIMDIDLPGGCDLPDSPDELLTWEDSRSYRNKGYFGWNSISKHLAAYYMTGDEKQAREAIRLAFPDAEAKKRIAEIDQERIENKDDPLAGAYHYNAHLMIVYWDLVEESPVFSDEERLRVTNAFARQLAHPDGARKGVYEVDEVRPHVSTRHGQWAVISNYCLGRYFARDYDDPVWKHLVRTGPLNFGCLNKYAWVMGEKDNLWWYCTSVAPVVSYLLLSGERQPVENGVLRKLLLGQDILVSGRRSEYYLRSASLGYLLKSAYLLRDGRYLAYLPRTGVDTSVFRLGQSYWPDADLKPTPPADLVGKWSIHRLAEPEWKKRRNGFPLEQSFHFGSYRSALGTEGDYLLLDGFNGASRNPYHTFAILGLRLDGERLLDGVLNQVTTRLDGMVEPKVAMNAALRRHDVIGETVCAVGEVPDAAYCNWRRTLLQRVSQYTLVADELTFRNDGDNAQVEIKWQLAPGVRANCLSGGTLSIATARDSDPNFIRAIGSKYRTNLQGPRATGELASHDVVLLRAEEPGAWIDLPFTLASRTDANMAAEFLGFVDRGVVRAYLDGKAVGDPVDHNTPAAKTVLLDMGHHILEAGDHVVRIEAVGKHPGVGKCFVGLSGIRVDRAAKKKAASRIDITCCDPLPVGGEGARVMEWVGAVEKGKPRRYFSLIAPTASDAKTGAICARLADNVAALSLPEPAVAVAGEWEGIRADMAVLAPDHLSGLSLLKAGLGDPLFESTTPVDVDWDFAAGRLTVVASEDAKISLSLEGGKKVSAVSAGRHVIENARPSLAKDMTERLQSLLARARAERVTTGERMAKGVSYDVPALPAPAVAKLPSAIVNLEMVPGGDGAALIAASEGETVHLVDIAGKTVRTLETDGKIRMTHWWPEPRLLLAGCTDEKVIAFDGAGKRRWVFVSEMDPAVFRAAKQYWFKSAPGHEGIHGLFSGKFIDGKPQAFVGSACTLEILDTQGKLVKRMPQFWGKNSTFAMLDRSDGRRKLLLSRKYSGTNRVNIIDPKTLNPDERGFVSTPPGHTLVSGWSSMNRHHIFAQDLDGDGKPEVMSEINGVWNRVTVWDEDGKALYNANFGPGARIPALNMRDIDVADLNGDGRKEIVVATWLGLVVGLDNQCNRLWSVRLDSAPRTLACIATPGGPRVIVGCDDGAVYLMDGSGRVIARGAVEGRADEILDLGVRDGKARVAFGTNKGTLAVFSIGD